MEVAIGANGSTPFQREVREWQRVDPNTGALLSGRLEADRWINGPLNAYGKVVDSQNVAKPNGTQHTQRKQLEVLQARTSSGSLQVVRAQTVQTSSSRWSAGTRTTQSFEGQQQQQQQQQQRFSNGLHLTNGHLPDGHDQQLTNNNHLNNRLLAAPSLKLSSLMKSSAATNGGRSSPHSITNSMSLVQKHQQQFQQQRQKHESESRSSRSDRRYHQPTLGEVCVGGGSSEPMESFRNEREIQDSNNSLQLNPVHLHRGRSVSTDDLSTEWNQLEDGDEPSEWRRVSKIRRSFQFPKSSSPKPTVPRPPDLPENSVSVSRIREELENGRRLSTAMRNNHVDLVALDSILNGTPDTEAKGAKKSSFLTAESLKEIRGKLKKLSDESLYKDDFVTQSDIDREGDEKSECVSGLNVEQPVILQDSHIVQQSAFQYRPKLENPHTTNSLENRTRYRDTTSSEWHLRRKSYGFEKMTPQDHSIFRSKPSTDSGIGRSGELSNWSPTENTPRTTIIKFRENSSPTTKTTVTVMTNGHESSSPKPIVQRRFFNRSSDPEEVKRHSIAVDESKYVRDNLRKVFDSKTSIHLNGLYVKEANSSQVSIGEDNGRKQKRVEFCKTEVHFAAESGKVNIVETDGKPPPTNNFRRRRRSSGGTILLDAISSGLPVIHFGDEKKTIFEQETAIEETQSIKNNVTVSLSVTNGIQCSEPSTVSRDEEEETADEISLRGILKNKPIKPKPYHLGENIESNDSLWGVRLRPVAGELLSSKSKVEEDGPSKLTTDTKPSLDLKEDSSSLKSVAERIRIVEERKGESGYSTKINLNMSNSPYAWSSPVEVPKSNVLSIELGSIKSPIKKPSHSPLHTPPRAEAPMAQPRTLTSVKTTRSAHNETTEKRSTYRSESIRSPPSQKSTQNKVKEPLKVGSGGARKLREHELSYFGVKVNSYDEKPKASQKRIVTNPETNRKVITNSEISSKWKLPSDKPDLLRHSPDGSTTTPIGHEGIEKHKHISDGPIYENLKKPSVYSRKKDLQRDEMILSEMTKTADQTLKAVTSTTSHKDHPKRTQQISTKPLDTIEESLPSQSRHQQKSMKSKGVQVSRPAGEGFQRQCCTNRPSSASSTESLSRLSSSSSLRRSRSRSRDPKDKIEYADIKPTKKVVTSSRESTRMKSRSNNSHDAHRTHASSSEDLANIHRSELARKVRRSKEKDARVLAENRRRSTLNRTSAESEDKIRVSSRSGHDQTRSSHRSAKPERTERISSSRSKASPSTATNDSHQNQKSRTKSSAGTVSSARSSASSKRPNKDHSRK